MAPSIHQIRASLGRFCLGEAIASELSDYAPAFEACLREYRDADEDGIENIIDFWGDIVQRWVDCQSDPRPVRILTDSFGSLETCESLPCLYGLICQLAADNGGRWFEDDGLREGRDFEYMTMLMNPTTGSVAPREEWKQDFREMTSEEWAGTPLNLQVLSRSSLTALAGGRRSKMAREYYEVCYCGGPCPEQISKHWTLSGAQKAFRARNRHIFDRSYAQRHGLANTGTFDKIFFVDREGERQEVPYGD